MARYFNPRCSKCGHEVPEVHTAICLGCGTKHKLCSSCFPIWTGDSDECRAKHRATMKKAFFRPSEKLKEYLKS